jgi:hypothetical protein
MAMRIASHGPGPIGLGVGGRKEAYFAKYYTVEDPAPDEESIGSRPELWAKEKDAK